MDFGTSAGLSALGSEWERTFHLCLSQDVYLITSEVSLEAGVGVESPLRSSHYVVGVVLAIVPLISS